MAQSTRTGTAPAPGAALLLVHGGDERSARGGRERVLSHAHLRELDGHGAALEDALEQLLEAAGLRRAAGQHEGKGALRPGELVGGRERAAQLADERLHQVLVIDMEGLLQLVLRRAR